MAPKRAVEGDPVRTEAGASAPGLGALLAGGILLLAVLLAFPLSPFALSQFDNTSVQSRVNVTNAAPAVLQVVLYEQGSGPGVAITLSEGTTTEVVCNATYQDNNGYQDINITNSNATAWINPIVGFTAADDNNNHYTNRTCTITQINTSAGMLSCSFQFEYYALNDSRWLCNATVQDLDGLSAYNRSEDATVAALYAINLTTFNESMMLDFGNMAPGDITADAAEQYVNVTNSGNINISLSIGGYGVNASDGLAMNCTVGNISADNLRYNYSDNQAFATSMFNLTVNALPGSIPALRIPVRVDDGDTEFKNSTNTTFWKLSVPAGTKGFCNGTVIFSAVP